MRRVTLTALLVVALAPLSGAHACICEGPPALQEISGSDIVFSGVVERVIAHPKELEVKPESGLVEYRFKVGQVWYGAASRGVTVYSDQSSCGADFQLGEFYFVCASTTKATNRGALLVTSSCLSCPLEVALFPRVALHDPVVVDEAINLERPSESELEELTHSDHARLAKQAKRALQWLQDVTQEVGENPN